MSLQKGHNKIGLSHKPARIGIITAGLDLLVLLLLKTVNFVTKIKLKKYSHTS